MKNEDTKQEQLQLGKEIAYHQLLLSSWTETRMERDKQVLTLSALAIGLLVTLRSELDDCIAVCVWLFAVVLFLVSVMKILWVFRHNSKYIEQIIKDDDPEKMKKIAKDLQRNTLFVDWMFVIGVILTAFLAVYGTELVTLNGEINVGRKE